MMQTLRQRNFLLMWLGGLISLTGDWIFITTLPFHVLYITKSVTATGAIFLAYSLPALLFGSVAGVFVDRWNKQRIMIYSNICQALVLLPLLLLQRADQIWMVYVVVFLQQSLLQVFRPAENAFLPTLVKEENLASANALNSINDNIARLAGPALGGVLFSLIGFAAVIILDSLSFVLAAAMITLVVIGGERPIQSTKSQSEIGKPSVSGAWRNFWDQWIDGLRSVNEMPLVRGIFFYCGLALIANGIITALLAVFADQVLHAGAIGLGLMFTTRGVGGLIGSVLVGHLANRLSPGYLIAPSLAAVGVFFLLLFNIPIFYLTLIFTALLGPAMMGWLVSGQTLLQTNVAEQYRGRVFGAYGTTAAIAGLVGTGVASAFGNSATLVTLLNTGAVLYILAGIVALSVIQKYRLEPILSK